MKPSKHFISIVIAVTVSMLTLIGCGGGSSAPSSPVPPPAKTTTFVVMGSIISLTGNDVQINNTQYNLSSSSITLDGIPASYNDLRMGMIVTLKGTRTSAKSNQQADTVATVIFEDELEGPVSSIDLAAETFLVLGVEVHVDGLTVFEGVTLGTLGVGNVVEVSGFQNGDGSVLATLVELESLSYTDGDEIEVKGTITGLDDVAQTFFIGSLQIDYSQAIITDIPNNTLVDGLFVEAKSISDVVAGVLIASDIEGKNEGIDGNEGDEVEVEGIVSAFTDTTDFEVDGQAVTTTSSTFYENGTVDDIQLGVKLEAEGDLNATGVLNADKIEFKSANDIKIEAPISAINSTDMTVTVLNIVVQLNELTLLKDESDVDLAILTINDLNIDDFVEIRASIVDGQILAGKLEREDPDDEVKLQGVVDSLTQPDIIIMGVNIITDVGTQFEDGSGNSLTANAFFAMDLAGSLVEVKGVFDGTTLTAFSVEIED